MIFWANIMHPIETKFRVFLHNVWSRRRSENRNYFRRLSYAVSAKQNKYLKVRWNAKDAPGQMLGHRNVFWHNDFFIIFRPGNIKRNIFPSRQSLLYQVFGTDAYAYDYLALCTLLGLLITIPNPSTLSKNVTESAYQPGLSSPEGAHIFNMIHLTKNR